MNRSGLKKILLTASMVGCIVIASFAADSSVDSLLNRIEDSNNTLEQAKLNLEVSAILLDESFDRSMRYAVKSYQLSMQASHDSTLHNALDIIRYIHYMYGDYENLLRYSLEALRVAKRIPYPEWVADDHGWLLMAHLELGNIKKALSEGERAIEISMTTGDTVYMCRAHTDIMNALREDGQFERALEHGTRALHMYRAIGDDENEAFTFTEIADLYLKQAKYELALENGLAGKRLLDEINSENVVRLWNSKAIARAYLGLDQHEKAEAFVSESQLISEKINATKELIELLELASQIAERNGDLDSALATYKEFKHQSDSITAANNTQRMLSIQAAFDLEASTAEANRLRELNLINSSHLDRQSRMNTYLWIGSSALFITLVITLFFGWRNRKMKSWIKLRNSQLRKQQDMLAEKELELEQQQIRLTSALMSDSDRAKQIDEATKLFRQAVKLQYQTVKDLADRIIDQDESGKQYLQDRISSIESTVLNAFNGSATYRRNAEELFRTLAATKAQDLSTRTAPMVTVRCKTDKLTDDDLFHLGLIIQELVIINYASLSADQQIQFIRINIEHARPDLIGMSFESNVDPTSSNQHSDERVIAEDILALLLTNMGASSEWISEDTCQFRLLHSVQPDIGYAMQAS